MIADKIAPDEPMRAPTIVKRLLLSINLMKLFICKILFLWWDYPSAQSAHPLYEFKTVITTGISAPPIAIVRVTPIIEESKEVAPSIDKPVAMLFVLQR